MLTIIGVVYNSISPLSTGTTTGQSQTLMMIQSARFSNQKLNFLLRYEMAPNPSWPSSAKITPYVLAILFTTWKLGGVFALLDCHTPRKILERMLFNIVPTCVLAPSTEPASVLGLLQKILKGENFSFKFLMSATNESLLDLSLPCLPFDNTTVTVLSQRYLDQSCLSFQKSV
jgi:hypothetical protein